MSHFDEFWNRAASAAQTAASATKRAANSAKLSIAIAAEEEKVKSAYQAIGKLYYQDQIAAATPSGPLQHRLHAAGAEDRPMMSRSAGSMPPFSALGSFAASGT